MFIFVFTAKPESFFFKNQTKNAALRCFQPLARYKKKHVLYEKALKRFQVKAFFM